MSRVNYEQIYVGADGWSEWFDLTDHFKIACCDCGLVHDFQVKASGKLGLQYRVNRNDRATAAHRRERKKRGQHTLSFSIDQVSAMRRKRRD